MKHSQKFIDWYNAKHGEVTVNEFSRFGQHADRQYAIQAYASHMSMMPSVVQERYEDWLNG